jgi:uncharacterized protein (TIGR03067 family)
VTKPTCWIVLAALFLLGANQPKKAGRTDRARLQGAWKVVSGEANGKPAPEDAVKGARMVFQGNRVTARTDNGKTRSLTFKLRPGRRPKAIDLTNPARKQTLLGIYSLKGDTLRVCFGAPGAARPKTLAAKEGSNAVLFVLKRIPSGKSQKNK